MRTALLAMFLVPIAACGPRHLPPANAASDEEVKATLVRISEEIVEAIRVGDKQAIEKHLAPDMRLINRDGKEYPKSELVDDLVPPRDGYDLRFKLLEPLLFRNGDSALLSFVLDEYLTIFGQNASTLYRNHFLFHQVDGSWKLVLYTYWEKPRSPPPIVLPASQLTPLEGTYEIAPGKWTTHIRVEAEGLVHQREGGEPKPFRAMAGDRFFLEGVEAEYFFERDSSGRATALVFRRNWVDVRLSRVK